MPISSTSSISTRESPCSRAENSRISSARFEKRFQIFGGRGGVPAELLTGGGSFGVSLEDRTASFRKSDCIFPTGFFSILPDFCGGRSFSPRLFHLSTSRGPFILI